MHNKQELCNKIVEMHPEIGKCEIDIMVDWDDWSGTPSSTD